MIFFIAAIIPHSFAKICTLAVFPNRSRCTKPRPTHHCEGRHSQPLSLPLFPPACRFRFFLDKVLPQYKDAAMSHTLIYVPSYFDYVRLRNHMKKEELNFASISEYSGKAEVSRARNFFRRGDKHFVLFTERFHFYKRSVGLAALFRRPGLQLNVGERLCVCC